MQDPYRGKYHKHSACTFSKLYPWKVLHMRAWIYEHAERGNNKAAPPENLVDLTGKTWLPGGHSEEKHSQWEKDAMYRIWHIVLIHQRMVCFYILAFSAFMHNRLFQQCEKTSSRELHIGLNSYCSYMRFLCLLKLHLHKYSYLWNTAV